MFFHLCDPILAILSPHVLIRRNGHLEPATFNESTFELWPNPEFYSFLLRYVFRDPFRTSSAATVFTLQTVPHYTSRPQRFREHIYP